jgi:hypothetical protein
MVGAVAGKAKDLTNVPEAITEAKDGDEEEDNL